MLNRTNARLVLLNHNRTFRKMYDEQVLDPQKTLIYQFEVIKQAVQFAAENNIHNFKKFNALLDTYKNAAGIKEIYAEEPCILIRNFLASYSKECLDELFKDEKVEIKKPILNFYEQLRENIREKPVLLFKSKTHDELVIQFPAELYRQIFFKKLAAVCSPFIYLEKAKQDSLFIPANINQKQASLRLDFPLFEIRDKFINLLGLDKQDTTTITVDKFNPSFTFNDKRILQTAGMELPLSKHLNIPGQEGSMRLFEIPSMHGLNITKTGVETSHTHKPN